MKSIFLVLAAALAATALLTPSCKNVQGETKTPAYDSTLKLIARGEYLVNTTGCDDCHSPKQMGPQGPEIIPELRLSGYPSGRPIQKADSNVVKQGWALFGPDLTSAVGPWGMSFAANLTSDGTGIGNWKEEQFINAIRNGKWKGLDANRPLLPPMPWFVYRNMTDYDLRAIYAFLKTTKPVKNMVPMPKPFSELN
ncbi:c-type cytochrome [Foetidibacter luteolus]|uniref:c-type cytochrome n=1 Tax=Foetidibacter luteolus TaxID=2608880 RepID=UPI00129C04B3|nr:c-type cytochrome [Foetidibacter luteolus]